MSSHLAPSEDTKARSVMVLDDLPPDLRERLTAALNRLGVTVHEGETLKSIAERLRAEPLDDRSTIAIEPIRLNATGTHAYDLPTRQPQPPTPNRAQRRAAAKRTR